MRGWLVALLIAAGISAAGAGLLSSGSNPPTPPLGLNANAQNGSVDLNWAPATDAVSVTGYIVYRNGVQIGTPSTTTYSDSGVSNGTTYTYYVKAVDAAASSSAASVRVTVTPHNLGSAPFTQGAYGPPDRTVERGINCDATSPGVNVTLPAQSTGAANNGCYSYWPPTASVFPVTPVVLVFQGTASNIAACSALTVDQCVQAKDESGTASWYTQFNAGGSTYMDSLRAAGFAVVMTHVALWGFGSPPTTCCAQGWRADPADQSYVSAVLDDLPGRFAVDRNREYLFGFSAGTHETQAAMCELNTRLAGVVNESQDLFGPSRSTASNFYPCPQPEARVPALFTIGLSDSPTFCGNTPCDPFVLGTSDPTVQLSGSVQDYSQPHSATSWAWRMGCTNPTSGYTTTSPPGNGMASGTDTAFSWTTGCGLSPKTGKTADVTLVEFNAGHTQNYAGLAAYVVHWITTH